MKRTLQESITKLGVHILERLLLFVKYFVNIKCANFRASRHSIEERGTNKTNMGGGIRLMLGDQPCINLFVSYGK